MTQMSVPPSGRWVAKPCCKVCGGTLFGSTRSPLKPSPGRFDACGESILTPGKVAGRPEGPVELPGIDGIDPAASRE